MHFILGIYTLRETWCVQSRCAHPAGSLMEAVPEQLDHEIRNKHNEHESTVYD